jgi:lysophospholipase
VLLPGRTEFLEKLTLPAGELVARGFSVAALDWRGQGLSDRLLPEPAKGHVRHFAEYRHDLAALLAEPRVAALPGPRVLVGHSMGGAIALGAVADGLADAPRALVLTAPMLGIRLSRGARAAARALTAAGRMAQLASRWPPMPGARRPYVQRHPFAGNVLTGDEALYRWCAEALAAEPRLRLGAPTLGWLRAAMREMRRLAHLPPPSMPCLVTMGTREVVVDPQAVRHGARRIGADFAEIEGARHDLFLERREHRRALWQAVEGFLDRHLGM